MVPMPDDSERRQADASALYEAPAIEAREPVYSLINGVTVVSGA